MNVDLNMIWNGIFSNLDDFETDKLTLVRSAVMSELGKYNFTLKEANTELVAYDDDNAGYQMFFLSKKVEGLSLRTLKAYKDTIDAFLRRTNKPIKSITTDDIRFYLAIRQTRDKVSVVTSENERRYLSSFFGWLTDEGYISKNPSKPIKKTKTRKVKKKAFSEIEIVKIKDTCLSLTGPHEEERRARAIALVEFLLSTGCRVGEVAELRRENVDLEAQTAIVIGKGNKERMVFLSNTAKYRLIDYWNLAGDAPFVFSSVQKGNRTLGNRMEISGIEIEIRRIGKLSGVSNCHPHRFRRTCATLALKKGMSLIDVQQMLGHESLDTTRIYLDLDSSDLKYQHSKCF